MKKSFSIILAFLQFGLIFHSVTPAYAAALPITASSAILIDHATHQVVYSKTPHLKRAPASTTKVLTAIVAVENLDLNQIVTIPSFVTSIEPSKIYLKPGERYRVRDLVKAALISSANDAAETLGYVTAGSRSGFAKMMNAKVRSIGGKHSNFVRASGLPAENQYSTAYDLALIMKEADRYPFIVEALKIKNCAIYSLSGRKIWLKNHNKMLWRDPREIIGKTGWTRSAKHCFVGHIKAQGRTVFVAMLGSRALWKDLKKLVDSQFGSMLAPSKKSERVQAVVSTKKVQSALKKSGFFKGPITGFYGPVTRSAVKKFQKSKGLKPDGVVGPQTWALLKTAA